VVLKLERYVSMPQHTQGGFDHGDVYLANGFVYIAHTANGTVEVMDGIKGTLQKTILGCPEGSGVVIAQADGLVFAASRGTGKVLVIHAAKGTVSKTIQVGSKPNGLAWDDDHGVLMVADVADLHARLVDPDRGEVLKASRLPGRPRWCSYSGYLDRFVINLRDPAGYVTLSPRNGEVSPVVQIKVPGPHGLDLSADGREAYIACDGGAVVAMDLDKGVETCRAKIPGEPDVTWLNARRKFLYCALPKPGLLASIDLVEMKTMQLVKTEEGAGTFAFDQSRQRLYSFLPKTCRVATYIES
jgi:DNA-binding beta-propeller fold protein YncE